jgi:hypothetical protein
MKFCPLFLCRFRTSVIRSFFVIFVLLLLPKSIVAMSSAHNASLYPSFKDDAYVHAAPDSCHVHPDYSWDDHPNSWRSLTERDRGIHAAPLDLASYKALFDRNLAKKDGLPVNGDGISSIITDAAASSHDNPPISYPVKEVAKKGGSFDTGEEDKQGPFQQSLLSVSIHATFSSHDVIGAMAPEEFWEYGVAAIFRRPWAWYSQSGWGGEPA